MTVVVMIVLHTLVLREKLRHTNFLLLEIEFNSNFFKKMGDYSQLFVGW